MHLDLFITSLQPIQWLTADLKRVVDLRLDRKRPVIVEGVLVLDALVHIGRKADFVVFVTGGTGIALASPTCGLSDATKTSRSRRFHNRRIHRLDRRWTCDTAMRRAIKPMERLAGLPGGPGARLCGDRKRYRG